jgi:two-component system, NtrC family, sensor kinase
MRIATRLVLVLGGVVLGIVALYVVVSHQQRQALLRGGMTRDTETLARALQVGAAEALRQGRLSDLDRILRGVVIQNEELFATVVLDVRGEVLAGDGLDLACLRSGLPGPVPATEATRGWMDCDPHVFWVSLPVPAPGAALVLAQREVLLNRAVAAALRRQLLLTLVLMGAIAGAIVLVLRRSLSAPLAELMRGIRGLEAEGSTARIALGTDAGELAELAAAFNEMATRLAEKREQLVRQAEERVEVERRLREAERFAVIGRISSGMAHELGSPLSVIGLRAEAIEAAPGAPTSAIRHAAEIARQARAITDFIQSLLLIGRQHGVVFERVDLARSVEAVLAEVEPWLEENDIALEAVLPTGPVPLRGQDTLLRHAVRNLVRNAGHALREHTGPGERRIRVRLSATDHEARILVEDNGPGVEPELLERVLEPFFTTKDVGAGTGLGLPIARGIVEEHGGELYVENRAEGGLRVVLLLPTDGAC